MTVSASPTNPVPNAAPETTSDATVTDTPTASDAPITKEEIKAAQMAVTEEIIKEGGEVIKRISALYYKAGLLAASLKDASILNAVVGTIIAQANLMGEDAILRLTGMLAEGLSLQMSDSSEKSSGSLGPLTNSGSSVITYSKEDDTSASQKAR